MKPFLVIGSGVFFLLILITGGLIIYLTRDNNGPTETQNPGSIYLFVDVCSFQRENNNSRIGTFRGITKYIEDVAMLGITHLMIIETNVGVLPGRTMTDLKQLIEELKKYNIEVSFLKTPMFYIHNQEDSAYQYPYLFQTYEIFDSGNTLFFNYENMFMKFYFRKMNADIFDCGIRDFTVFYLTTTIEGTEEMDSQLDSVQNYILDSHKEIFGSYPNIYTASEDIQQQTNKTISISKLGDYIFSITSFRSIEKILKNSTEFGAFFENTDGTRTITLYDYFYEDFGVIYGLLLFSPITIMLPERLGIYRVNDQDNHQTIIDLDEEESRQYITAKYVLNYKKFNTSFTEGQDLILVHELSNQTFIGVAGSTFANQDKEYILIVINNSEENIDVPVATLSNLVNRTTFDLIYDSSENEQEIIRVTSQKVRVRSVQCIVLKAL